MSELNEAQRHKLAARLAMRVDRTDAGQLLPATAAALALGTVQGAIPRLEALAQSLFHERVILPINVEEDPRGSGVHVNVDPGSCEAADFARVMVEGREALVAYSSAVELERNRPGARPMTLPFQKVALTALVETSGRVVVNPGADEVLLPRSCVAALAQGDRWLPAWRDGELLEQLHERYEGLPGAEAVRDVRVVPAAAGMVVRVEVLVDRDSLSEAAVRTRARGAGRDRLSEHEIVAGLLTALQSAERLIAAGDRIELVPLPWQEHVA